MAADIVGKEMIQMAALESLTKKELAKEVERLQKENIEWEKKYKELQIDFKAVGGDLAGRSR